jgi:hypothetical protein
LYGPRIRSAALQMKPTLSLKPFTRASPSPFRLRLRSLRQLDGHVSVAGLARHHPRWSRGLPVKPVLAGLRGPPFGRGLPRRTLRTDRGRNRLVGKVLLLARLVLVHLEHHRGNGVGIPRERIDLVALERGAPAAARDIGRGGGDPLPLTVKSYPPT